MLFLRFRRVVNNDGGVDRCDGDDSDDIDDEEDEGLGSVLILCDPPCFKFPYIVDMRRYR